MSRPRPTPRPSVPDALWHAADGAGEDRAPLPALVRAVRLRQQHHVVADGVVQAEAVGFVAKLLKIGAALGP
jgi:hypothetical protein